MWLPAVGALLGFGGVALVVGGGSAVWWSAAAALVCAGAYAVRERWPVLALALSLLVVAGARLPGAGVLQSGFDVAYLLLLFVPVLPLVATASVLAPRWSGLGLLATVLVTVAVAPEPVWAAPTYSARGTLVGYVLAAGVPAMVALGAWFAGLAYAHSRVNSSGRSVTPVHWKMLGSKRSRPPIVRPDRFVYTGKFPRRSPMSPGAGVAQWVREMQFPNPSDCWAH